MSNLEKYLKQRIVSEQEFRLLREIRGKQDEINSNLPSLGKQFLVNIGANAVWDISALLFTKLFKKQGQKPILSLYYFNKYQLL